MPLAEAFITKGFTVKGSTTTPEKIADLKNAGVDAYLVSAHEDSVHGDVGTLLKGSEILVIDIPPKLRKGGGENFPDKIRNLIPYIENAGIKKVVFVSSTSVYPDDNSIFSDDVLPKPKPDSITGEQLLEAEQLLNSNKCFCTNIIRFGGLIAQNRHPVYFLSGRDGIANPDAPVNLIHRDDCIGIIITVAEKDIWGETFNAVAPFHPARDEYYIQKAQELALTLPKFNYSVESVGKTILSDKIELLLNYTFKKQP